MAELTFNLEKLFETYSTLVAGNYKSALLDLQETDTKYQPPKLDIETATVLDAAKHIQNCTGYYGVTSKLASYARASHKLAEGAYKQQHRHYVSQSDGKNESARVAEADALVVTHYEQMIFFETALFLFSAIESAARTAADSSRKIAELINSHHIAEVGNKN
ncbi:MAG: hypothetical protein ACJA1A_003585 [Saprospiraceae bacterium]|jgi:hypothetical protein